MLIGERTRPIALLTVEVQAASWALVDDVEPSVEQVPAPTPGASLGESPPQHARLARRSASDVASGACRTLRLGDVHRLCPAPPPARPARCARPNQGRSSGIGSSRRRRGRRRRRSHFSARMAATVARSSCSIASRSSGSGSYGAGCIVTSADRYSNEMRSRRSSACASGASTHACTPRLHVVAQPMIPRVAGLVVVGVEDVVVAPERVDARARHERRTRAELEPRACHLVTDGDGTLRAVLGVSGETGADLLVLLGAVAREDVGHQRVVLAGALFVHQLEERVHLVAVVGGAGRIARGHHEQRVAPLARAAVPGGERRGAQAEDRRAEVVPLPARAARASRRARGSRRRRCTARSRGR